MAKKTTKKSLPAKRVPSQAKRKARSNRKPTAPILEPAFRGGNRHGDDEICACDVVLADAESTLDESLPASMGGVESIGLKGQ